MNDDHRPNLIRNLNNKMQHFSHGHRSMEHQVEDLKLVVVTPTVEVLTKPASHWLQGIK